LPGDFECGWVAKEAAAATKAMEDQAVKAVNEVALYLDKY